MTPTTIAEMYLPKFFNIGEAMNGVEHNKDTKLEFTAVLVEAITLAYAENAKLAWAVAPLKDNGTHNEYTDIIANAILAQGSVPVAASSTPAEKGRGKGSPSGRAYPPE